MYDVEKAAHKLMWKWVSANPSSHKSLWPGWKNRGGIINSVENNCFACHIAMQTSSLGYPDCNMCPIDWGKVGTVCSSDGSMWAQYCDAHEHRSYEDVSEVALKIANVKWKL